MTPFKGDLWLNYGPSTRMPSVSCPSLLLLLRAATPTSPSPPSLPLFAVRAANKTLLPALAYNFLPFSAACQLLPCPYCSCSWLLSPPPKGSIKIRGRPSLLVRHGRGATRSVHQLQVRSGGMCIDSRLSPACSSPRCPPGRPLTRATLSQRLQV